MTEDHPAETFEEFKNSFNYGSRTDLNFKFLKNFPVAEAARFFQELLWNLGNALNDGDSSRIIEFIYQSQVKGYAGSAPYTYETAPFTPLKKPFAEIELALLTSSGHFVQGDDPEPFGVKGLTQEEAIARSNDFAKVDPQLSEIPIDTPEEKLRVRHPGYDIRGALADPNVNFPLTRLIELKREGLIGKLHPTAYSFMGICTQMRLLKQTGPRWVERFKDEKIDAFLLVPV